MSRRKPRHKHKLGRRPHQRDTFDRVLIVCEGKKTEPKYIEGLLHHHRLSMVRVVGKGSDPSVVVKEAKKKRLKEKKHRDDYDKVFCVFDRDEHTTFETASEEANKYGLTPIRSWPCFEFWILLHYRYTRSPYGRSGEKTAAHNCLEDVQQYLPGYTKGAEGIFQELEKILERAKRNSEKAFADAMATSECNPSTEIHILVNYLQSLASKK